jgi:sulfite reductase (NADPH) flavoprotein alpha-component
MKQGFLLAHRLTGLCAALFLIALGLTGSVIAFENDWNRMLNPQILRVTPRGRPLAWEVIRRGVEAQEPQWRVQRIYMPASESDSTYVRLVSRVPARSREIYVDQYSGRILGRKELANQLIWKIHELHINLGTGVAGSQFVFGASIALLLLAVSGLYLWWPRRIFQFRAGPQFSRTNYDLHRALGFWSSVAMALFAITGINLHLQTGGGLFAMMDAKSTPVDRPGHGVTADAMLQSAAEALPGARLMRISFWGGKRPTLVQMRFPRIKLPPAAARLRSIPKPGGFLR